MRVCPKQLKFAEITGLDNTVVSALENGKLKLRADHLLLIADTGVDILYVITGKRASGTLPAASHRLIDSFARLDVDVQQALLLIAARLAQGPE